MAESCTFLACVLLGFREVKEDDGDHENYQETLLSNSLSLMESSSYMCRPCHSPQNILQPNLNVLLQPLVERWGLLLLAWWALGLSR